MTQERLDVADVSAALQHMGGRGVAEQVTGRIQVRVFEALQRSTLDDFLDDAGELLPSIAPPCSGSSR